LGVAVEQLLALGVDRVAARIGDRTDEVRAVLAGHPALTVGGTPADRGIVTFVHERLAPHEIGQQLAHLGVAARVTPAGAPMDGRGAFAASVRLSPHECTTDDELAHLDDALGRLA
jgi:selenocysteine lyase/cysteine desulfurase